MQLWEQQQIQTLLPSIAVMLVVSIVLRRFLIHKEWKIRMIPFQIVAILIVLLEIGKQSLSFVDGYDLYHLLFHFCSLVVIMVPVMAFYRGKYQQQVIAITASLLTSVALLMFIYPALIYSGNDVDKFFTSYFAFHTVSFHTLSVFAFFLLIALELYTPVAKAEWKSVMWFIVVFCVISATMSQLLETNFNNFYSCNVPPLEEVRISLQGVLGYGLTQLIYVLIVTVLDILFVQMSYWMIRGIAKLLLRAKVKKV